MWTVVSVFCLLAVEETWGAVALGKAEYNKSNSSLCLEPGTTGPSYMIGSVWYPRNMCARAMCNERGNQLYVSYATCGLSWSPPNCVTSADSSLLYPHCCPKSVCPEDAEMLAEAGKQPTSGGQTQTQGQGEHRSRP
eukprot:TRINITY_DN9446_c0_g1_i1.p1 TRINITY_DN9446_c0_g1~~TRINITY_DN9446_c0_g1_i1.p1  ORF type:complete len:137 (+),score=34.11 TRINITY_DN9446_c0_g1_i1:95-505(+)